MSDFEFAAEQPRQAEEEEHLSPFASHSDDQDEQGSDQQQGGRTGMQALQGNRQLRDSGANPQQGLMAMATLIGMARHMMPGVDGVDSPTGLMSLLRSPVHGDTHTSDGQQYNLDLSRTGTAGGNMAGTKTALGTAGGAVQNAAQAHSIQGAMGAIGNLSHSMGSGMAHQLSEAGKMAQGHMQWLGQGVKDIYQVRRK